MTQMMHGTGLYLFLLPGIFKGASVVLAPAFDASLVLNLIERFQCTYAIGFPPFLRSILEEQASRPRNVASMKTFFAGGDSVPVNDFRKMFTCLQNLLLPAIYPSGRNRRSTELSCQTD
jgi:acyl-CoA synthetase (AMP-forming)/AMP-acid ligase II